MSHDVLFRHGCSACIIDAGRNKRTAEATLVLLQIALRAVAPHPDIVSHPHLLVGEGADRTHGHRKLELLDAKSLRVELGSDIVLAGILVALDVRSCERITKGLSLGFALLLIKLQLVQRYPELE